MEGHASVSTDVLAAYASDAALQVAGVAPRGRRRHVRIVEREDGVSVELRLMLEWGASIGAVGRSVQERVAGYLARMAEITPRSVEVIVDEIGPPAASA